MPPELQHGIKRLTVEATMKMDGDDAGRVTSVFSTFNVVDHHGHVVLPTAIKDGTEVAMVWSHDWNSRPVGKGRITVQPDRAIFDGQFFMDTIDGQEAYKTVKNMGNLQEWSWGFYITDAEWGETDDGELILYIKETEVNEVSPVLKGAGMMTRTLEIKSNLARQLDGLNVNPSEIKQYVDRIRDNDERALIDLITYSQTQKTTGRRLDEEGAAVLAAAKAYVARLESLADLRAEEGRVPSKASKQLASEVRDGLHELSHDTSTLVNRIDVVLKGKTPAPATEGTPEQDTLDNEAEDNEARKLYLSWMKQRVDRGVFGPAAAEQ